MALFIAARLTRREKKLRWLLEVEQMDWVEFFFRAARAKAAASSSSSSSSSSTYACCLGSDRQEATSIAAAVAS